MADRIDYRDLLERYILHVAECEGTEFLSDTYFGMSGVPFSDQEKAELRELVTEDD